MITPVNQLWGINENDPLPTKVSILINPAKSIGVVPYAIENIGKLGVCCKVKLRVWEAAAENGVENVRLKVRFPALLKL